MRAVRHFKNKTGLNRRPETIYELVPDPRQRWQRLCGPTLHGKIDTRNPRKLAGIIACDNAAASLYHFRSLQRRRFCPSETAEPSTLRANGDLRRVSARSTQCRRGTHQAMRHGEKLRSFRLSPLGADAPSREIWNEANRIESHYGHHSRKRSAANQVTCITVAKEPKRNELRASQLETRRIESHEVSHAWKLLICT